VTSLYPAYPIIAPPIPKSKRRRWTTFSTIVLIMLILAAGAAVAIPLVLLHKSKSGSSPSDSHSPKSTGAISGTNGSVVTTNNGSTFTFVNNFGGDWAYDPTNPFAPGGKAQSWSPRVGSEDWDWGVNTARGVNLGYVTIIWDRISSYLRHILQRLVR
jgi:glucan 1,3-beta-glucosidase